MPLYSARIRTSPSDGGANVSLRISPRPGAATQNAMASSGTLTHSVAGLWAVTMPGMRWGLSPGADAPLSVRLLRAGALGCVIVTGVGLMARPWLDAGVTYPWKTAGLFAAMMAAALAFVGEHPFSRLGPANLVTIARAMLVALTAGLIGESASHQVASTAVAFAVTAVLLDGVDGWLARRSGMVSEFGSRIDMETDALLIMVLSVLVWQHDKSGVWVLGCGLMRYAFVAAGWLLPWMAGPLTPTLRGKTVAVAQVAGLAFALLPVVPRSTSRLAAALTLAALTWSFAVDVRRLWARVG